MGSCFRVPKERRYTSLKNNEIWSTAELILTGYIREHEDDTEYIIPHTILSICMQYFTVKPSLFIHRSNTNNSTLCIQTSRNDEYDEMVNIIRGLRAPYCYIPNVIYNNLSYEAVLSFTGMKYTASVKSKIMTYTRCRTQIILFSQSNKAEITLQSKHNELSPPAEQFVYCGPKYGIIYKNSSYLYQLKMNQINSLDLKFRRVAVCSSNRASLCYLDNYEYLLVLSINYDGCPECKVFDLKTKQWITMKTYDLFAKKMFFELGDSNNAIIKACYSKSNNHNVYVLTNYGEAARFNVDKNEWSSLCTLKYNSAHYESCEEREHIVWNDDINPNILYCAICDVSMISVQTFRLDISDKSSTWERDNIQLVDNLKQIFLCGQ